MPQTPTDPTKAQVWVTGTAPNQQLEFYIPRGAKGEPGGLTLGTVLTGDLDQYKTPGIYRQSNSANALLLNHYPKAGEPGVMIVHDRTGDGNSVMQVYESFSNTAQASYRRVLSGGVWQPWRAYTSHRVDQTAGRVIYQWDDLNNREQLTYGDTGLRTVTADLLSGTANLVTLRRRGNTVQFRLVTWAKAPDPATGGETIFQLPVGFRPDTTLYSVPGIQRGTANRTAFDITIGGVITQLNPFLSSSLQLNATWITNDNWPTTLPGTATGTIPNL